ncbi:hypothetical protein LVJ82_15545 [Vitreoscilla massiliensis]|uniref:Phage protein n=1 Tax=Vitreoscilla massiliensis TaxID=1689272 RepID=A0ABY4E0H0_9NEIS|nr:hypothetical protein [Vitreoscilla massiliensis]UOO88851.1 hypothetical protein LVJ82_15545 [Vitreoscilla massiliensis]
MALLTKEQLLAKGKISPVLVNIKFPNGEETDVYMLDGRSGFAACAEMKFIQEIGAYTDGYQFINNQANVNQVMAFSMIQYLCNEQGEPLFKREELDGLLELPVEILTTFGVAIHKQHTIERHKKQKAMPEKAEQDEQNTTEPQDTANA